MAKDGMMSEVTSETEIIELGDIVKFIGNPATKATLPAVTGKVVELDNDPEYGSGQVAVDLGNGDLFYWFYPQELKKLFKTTTPEALHNQYEAGLQAMQNVVTESGCNDMSDILDTLKSLRAELAAKDARLAAVEAALRPFAEAAEDEYIKASAINAILRVMVVTANQQVNYPGIVYEAGWVNDDDSKFLEVRHLRAAADAIKGSAE